MVERQVPPYLPTSRSGVTTIGFLGRRSANGGSVPASASAFSIGASPIAAAKAEPMPVAATASVAKDDVTNSLLDSLIICMSPDCCARSPLLPPRPGCVADRACLNTPEAMLELNGSANAYFVKAHDKCTTKVAFSTPILTYQAQPSELMVMAADKHHRSARPTLLTISYFPLDRSGWVPHRG